MKHTLACALAISIGALSTTAYLQVKGGEEETGPYDLVQNWPQPFARPGYVMGSIAGVAADNPKELHGFTVDSEGNLYTADSYSGRAQKFTPKAGADRSRLVAF